MAEKYSVEGYWDCHYCGSKGIRGRHRSCPNCGKPRGEEVQFYLKEYGEEYAVEETPDKPDWLCEYCSSYNPDTADTCLSCGAAREAKTYADFRETKAELIHDADGNMVDDGGQLSDDERERLNLQQEMEDRRQREQANNERLGFASQTPPPPPEKKSGSPLRFIIPVVLVLLALFYFFSPKSVDLEVKGLSWQRSVAVQTSEMVQESDWKQPIGSQLMNTKREIHHYDRVLDHYETVYDTVTERVIDHYDTVRRKVDKGNGYFDVVTEKVPVYKNVQKRVQRREPVYASVPVYASKYYYLVERWKDTRTVDTAGNDKNPYFGKVELKSGTGANKVGAEREGARTEKYYLTAVVDGKEKKLQVDKAFWEKTKVGDKLKGKISGETFLPEGK